MGTRVRRSPARVRSHDQPVVRRGTCTAHHPRALVSRNARSTECKPAARRSPDVAPAPEVPPAPCIHSRARRGRSRVPDPDPRVCLDSDGRHQAWNARDPTGNPKRACDPSREPSSLGRATAATAHRRPSLTLLPFFLPPPPPACCVGFGGPAGGWRLGAGNTDAALPTLGETVTAATQLRVQSPGLRPPRAAILIQYGAGRAVCDWVEGWQ